MEEHLLFPIPAAILGLVFVALSAIHIYWAYGGQWGFKNAIPTMDGEPLFHPGKVSTIIVAAALLLAAIVAVWRGFFPHTGPDWVPRLGIWVLALVFAVRAIGDFRYCGFFKRVRGSEFARNDSLFYSPLCVLLSGMALWLAIGY